MTKDEEITHISKLDEASNIEKCLNQITYYGEKIWTSHIFIHFLNGERKHMHTNQNKQIDAQGIVMTTYSGGLEGCRVCRSVVLSSTTTFTNQDNSRGYGVIRTTLVRRVVSG